MSLVIELPDDAARAVTPEEIAGAQAEVDEFLANVRKDRVNIGNRSGGTEEKQC